MTRGYEHGMLLHHPLRRTCSCGLCASIDGRHLALCPLGREGIARSGVNFQATSEGRVLCMFEGMRMLKPSAAVDTIIPGI